MAKKITKVWLESEVSRLVDCNMAKERIIEDLKVKGGRKVAQIQSLIRENQELVVQNARGTGAFRTLQTQYELLLRKSLRAEGMNWDDINEVIRGWKATDYGSQDGILGHSTSQDNFTARKHI